MVRSQLKQFITENIIGIGFIVLFFAFFRRIIDLLELAFFALQNTLWGFNPSHFIAAYFVDGKLVHLLIGLFAMLSVLMSIIGIPHLIVNLISLVKDLPNIQGTNFGEKFIRRQNLVHEKYLQDLSDAEISNSNQTYAYSEADGNEVKEILSRIEKKDAIPLDGIFRIFTPNPYAKLTTLFQATVHFLISFSSFSKSAYVYTRVWNIWFAIRSFFPIFHPILCITFFLFPEYYRVSTSRLKQSTPPTRWNGGLRPIWEYIRLAVFHPKVLKQMRTAEAQVIEVETKFRELALIHATELSSKEKTYLSKEISFWNAYSDFFEQSMIAWSANRSDEFQPPPKKAVSISSFINAVWKKFTDSLSEKVDPLKSRQVQILQVTHFQLGNSKAMARAVRSMIASNLVDKPMELVFLFICYAGITEGLLMPLQREIFGPNSWFYLSRFVFINGFIYSVIAGIFSDTWLKIQQDVMNEGKFDHVPTGENAQLSFWRWQFKHTFWTAENSWWLNQKYTVLQYILPTTKATFVTALIVNYITLGRFDLDSFAANFLVLIFFPTTGLTWKIEQGFELASSWTVRDVPERLRAHPFVQSYFQRATAKRRIIFNFYYRVWENITWNYLITLMNMSAPAFGTRAFSRLIFGGFTPVEIVVNFIRSSPFLATLPGPIHWIFKRIDLLLTRGYTDGTRLL